MKLGKKAIVVGLTLGILGVSPSTMAKAETVNGHAQNFQVKVQNGWINSSQKWYFYKDNKLVKGWVLDQGKWYYMDKNDGHLLIRWQKIDGKWYYMEPDHGAMLKGWQKIDNKWYYLDENSGAMKTGWEKDGGKFYLLDKTDGHMLLGWQKVDGSWYYLENKHGEMVTGWQKIDNKWYYFSKDTGAMESDKIVDGCYLAKDGSYISKGQSLVEYGKKFLGKPYVWGATGPNSFDCSGFTSYVYRHAAGMEITRTTWTQIKQGKEIARKDLQVGDLVFTNNGGHVGIYAGNGKMIQAANPRVGVVIEPIHNYYKARRLL